MNRRPISNQAIPLVLALTAILLAGCATTDPTGGFTSRLSLTPEAGLIIDNVPPLASGSTREGIAAIAPLLRFWNKIPLQPGEITAANDPDNLAPEIERMMMAAETRDLWAYAFYGSIDALEFRLLADVPVLILLQDHPEKKESRRYALVFGFNTETKEVLLYDGKRQPAMLDYSELRRRWRPVRYWMMTAAPPTQADWMMSIHERAALARYWQRKGEWAKAIREYDLAQAHGPLNLDLIMAKAIVWQEAGDLAQAIALYREVLQTDSLNPRAANNLAFLLASLNQNLAEAESWSRRAVTHEPANPRYLDTLGLVLLKMDRPAEAAAALSRARFRARRLPLEERRAIATHLIEAYLKSEQDHLALQVFQEHRAQDPPFEAPGIPEPLTH